MATLWVSIIGRHILCTLPSLEHAYYQAVKISIHPISYLEMIKQWSMKAYIVISVDSELVIRIYSGINYPPDRGEWKSEWVEWMKEDEWTNDPLYIDRRFSLSSL